MLALNASHATTDDLEKTVTLGDRLIGCGNLPSAASLLMVLADMGTSFRTSDNFMYESSMMRASPIRPLRICGDLVAGEDEAGRKLAGG